MANEPKPLVFDNFQRGIAQSPAFGFQEMVGIDITTAPGFARVNPKLKLESSTTITDEVNWIKKDGTSVYALADNGTLYKRVNGTWSAISGTTGTAGSGLAIYKGYLFNFEGLTLEVYNLTTPGWVTTPFGGVAMPGGGTYGYQTVVGQDDILYATSNNFIISFAENDGKTFDPTDADTYTIKVSSTTPAVDLPDDYDIASICELGEYLYTAANNSDTNQSDIFPWDRTSPSVDLPVRMGMNDIHAAVAYGNFIYFIAGVEGSLYRTNGVGVEYINTLPESILNRGISKSIKIVNGAMCVFKNKIYFANSYTSVITTPAYIWSLDPKTGVLNIEHTLSTGVTGSGASSVNINCLVPLSDTQLMVGYGDNVSSVTGVDILDTTRRYTGYTAYIVSHLQPVGSYYRPRTFRSCQVNLTKPLASGEGVKVQIRESLSTAWSSAKTIGTFETAGQQSFEVPYAGTHKMLQVKISLTTPSGSESTPELVSVVLL